MLRDFKHQWSAGRVRKRLYVQFGMWSSIRYELGHVWRWLTFREPSWKYRSFCFPIKASVKHWQHENGNCYCREGSMSVLSLEVFSFRFRVELARNPVAWPCHCEKLTWLTFPDLHEDEIAEYGLAKLHAEYPSYANVGA